MANPDIRSGPNISPVTVGVKGVCPNCGQGRLFRSGLKPADRCMACGLDYGFVDSGDGPAVFVILILGFVILGAALALETALSPPIWLQVLIWVPVTLIACFWALRFSKGVMIALQFNTNANEGSFDGEGKESRG